MKFKTSYCWKLEYWRTEFSSPFLDLFWRSPPQVAELRNQRQRGSSKLLVPINIRENHLPGGGGRPSTAMTTWQGHDPLRASQTRTSPGVPAAAGLRFSHRLPMIIKASASRSRLQLHWNTRAMVKRLHMDCIWFMVIHPIKGILIIGV